MCAVASRFPLKKTLCNCSKKLLGDTVFMLVISWTNSSKITRANLTYIQMYSYLFVAMNV